MSAKLSVHSFIPWTLSCVVEIADSARISDCIFGRIMTALAASKQSRLTNHASLSIPGLHLTRPHTTRHTAKLPQSTELQKVPPGCRESVVVVAWSRAWSRGAAPVSQDWVQIAHPHVRGAGHDTVDHAHQLTRARYHSRPARLTVLALVASGASLESNSGRSHPPRRR